MAWRPWQRRTFFKEGWRHVLKSSPYVTQGGARLSSRHVSGHIVGLDRHAYNKLARYEHNLQNTQISGKTNKKRLLCTCP